MLKTAFIREYDENAFSFFEKAQDKEFTAVSFEGHMNFSGIRDKNGGVCLTDIFALPSAVSFGVNAKSIYGGEPVRIYLDCEDDALFEEAVKVASGFEINRFTPDEALFLGDETLFITGEYDFCESKASFFEKKCRLIKKYPINTVRTFDSEVLHNVRVHYRDLVFEAMCKEGEVLSSALLNAGVPSDIRCTDGECGYCTLRLVSGEVRSLLLTGDRRKGADVVYGFIHPCSVTPVSDIILEL